MSVLKSKYPFDPSIKHHVLIAAGLAVWVFVFLYFTEPLDVSELGDKEQLIYLPLYGLFAALSYLITLPLQFWLFKRHEYKWTVGSELLYFSAILIFGFLITRGVYYYIVIEQDPHAYTIGYFAETIYLPGVITIFPIIAAGRWSFGMYKEKKLEDQKVEIEGAGNYENFRLQLNDLIYIQSSDNYVEITYKENDELKKHLIRNKLSEVEKQRPELIRTHRSYLINTSHFKQWKTGNRKLILVLSNDLEVPVSKTYQAQVEQAVNFTTE